MKKVFAFVLCVCFFCFPASAHSGGTDSQGGHRDNKNVSGLGSYHYHHGMGPHLHPGGVCPYSAPAPTYTEPEPEPESDPLEGFEYDEDRNIYYGEWGIIDEDGYFHSYEEGVFDENGNFYLEENLEWCVYCDETIFPGQEHMCPSLYEYEYEDAPDYCYDCENIIESSDDHDEDCPSANPAPKYDFAAPVDNVTQEETVEQDKTESAEFSSWVEEVISEHPIVLVPFCALCYFGVKKLSKW